MEIIIGLLQDLNRHFKHKLTIMLDGNTIILVFFGQNNLLRYKSSYDLYKALSRLKELVSSYTNCCISTNSQREIEYITKSIYRDYNFDINEYFELQKYGKSN